LHRHAERARRVDSAFAALSRVDHALSPWKPSELTQLNDAGGGRASPDVLTVVAHGLDVASASSGAFDPTVEPIVRATGGLGAPPRVLDAAERRRLLGRVGFRRARVDLARGALRLRRGTRLDL